MVVRRRRTTKTKRMQERGGSGVVWKPERTWETSWWADQEHFRANDDKARPRQGYRPGRLVLGRVPRWTCPTGCSWPTGVRGAQRRACASRVCEGCEPGAETAQQTGKDSCDDTLSVMGPCSTQQCEVTGNGCRGRCRADVAIQGPSCCRRYVTASKVRKRKPGQAAWVLGRVEEKADQGGGDWPGETSLALSRSRTGRIVDRRRRGRLSAAASRIGSVTAATGPRGEGREEIT